MTYLVKCKWRATSLTLTIEEESPERALAKAKRDPIGRKAIAYEVIGKRPSLPVLVGKS